MNKLNYVIKSISIGLLSYTMLLGFLLSYLTISPLVEDTIDLNFKVCLSLIFSLLLLADSIYLIVYKILHFTDTNVNNKILLFDIFVFVECLFPLFIDIDLFILLLSFVIIAYANMILNIIYLRMSFHHNISNTKSEQEDPSEVKKDIIFTPKDKKSINLNTDSIKTSIFFVAMIALLIVLIVILIKI